MSYVKTPGGSPTKLLAKTRQSLKKPAVAVEEKRPSKRREEDTQLLQKSASDLNLQATKDETIAEEEPPANEGLGRSGSIKKVFSETTLSKPQAAAVVEEDSKGEEEEAKLPDVLSDSGVRNSLRRTSLKLKKHPQITLSSYAISQAPAEGGLAELPRALLRNAGDFEEDEPVKSPVNRIAPALPSPSLNSPALKSPVLVDHRRSGSFMLGSRSPSPRGRTSFDDDSTGVSEPEPAALRTPNSVRSHSPVLIEPEKREDRVPSPRPYQRRQHLQPEPEPEPEAEAEVPQKPQTRPQPQPRQLTPPEQSPKQQRRRRSSAGSSKAKRPLSAILTRTKSFVSEGSAIMASLPKSFSSERLPLSQSQTNGAKHDPMPAMPKNIPKEHKSSGTDTPKRKDELYSNFRTLDGEYHKFMSKPATLKTNIVRSSLLPFLRNFASHPSNSSLRAEDLDRRANVLNKWWTGLLEILNGRNGQSVSPSERPILLEALSLIMSRSEWRVPLSAISSKADKNRSVSKSRSSSSLESNMSDFLAESVIHNVRNFFTQNLVSQMDYVVEKMSQRAAPASVVTFCGKACAYAFLYCPGVADILVRLWSLKPETLRRVLQEFGVARNANLGKFAEEVKGEFPTHVQHLTMGTLAKLLRTLRESPSQSLSSIYIPWNSAQWVRRWQGLETDLFFGFVKHFMVLAAEMLPEKPSNEMILSSPCSLLVHGQFLAIMDYTIHRVPNQSQPEPTDGPLPITFDDVLGADASALPMATPIIGIGGNLLMAESRPIIMLREFLADSCPAAMSTKHSFAVRFAKTLKATAARTSLYDQNACVALCDFLEEAVAVLSRFFRSENPDKDPGVAFFDWDFWFDVLKKMSGSNNTMTEIRLFALVYTLWAFLCKDPDRKRDLCLGWLLDENFALEQFGHWCPMVRAYYMRLLCWRIARCEGGDPDQVSDADFDIYKAAQYRLRDVWSHFLWLQREAAAGEGPVLSTAPAAPAPGRRFLIVRDDSCPPASAVSFDGLLASTGHRYTSLDPLRQAPRSPAGSRESSPSRKRWSALKAISVLSSFGSSSNSGNNGGSASSSPPSSRPDSAKSDASSPSSSPPRGGRSTATSAPTSQPASAPKHALHSFKFSLEQTHAAHHQHHPHHPPPPNPHRRLTPPQLPAPAAALLHARLPGLKLPPPTRPRGAALLAASKYAGRACAEWNAVVAECQGFGERRMHEGTPGWAQVEVPVLGVEVIRRPVG